MDLRKIKTEVLSSLLCFLNTQLSVAIVYLYYPSLTEATPLVYSCLIFAFEDSSSGTSVVIIVMTPEGK